MAGPLTSLGQAIALGIGDIADTRRDDRLRSTARQQQLDDESRRRAQSKDDLKELRDFEEELYNRRRFDAIKDDLVRSGLLSVQDMSKPEAVEAALAKTSVDYRRKAEELANFKAVLPSLIQAVGTIEGADKVMGMTPDQVEQARAIVQGAYVRLGQKVDADRNLKEKNAKTAAALIAVELERKSSIQSKLNEIQQGIVSPEELQQAFREAAAKQGYTNEAQIPPDQRAVIQAEASELVKESQLVKGFRLQQALAQVERSFDNITDNTRAGVYGYLDQAPRPVTPPSGVPAAAVTADDEAAALRTLQGDEQQQPTRPASSLSIEGGAAPVTSAKGLLQRAPAAAEAIGTFPGVAINEIGRYGAAAMQGLWDGNYAVPEKGVVDLAGEGIGRAIGGDYEDWNADLDKAVLGQMQSLQQRLNSLAPDSPAAEKVRSQIRSLQFQLSKPATALGE